MSVLKYELGESEAMTRQERIVAMCEEQPYVSVAELIETLGVSPATVRRDLATLEQEGRIQRVRGGVTRYREESINKRSDAPDFTGIAKLAASMIKPRQMIFIDSGATTLALVEHITDNSISVMTNGLLHARILSEKGISTFVLPGFVRYDHCSISCDEAISYLAQYKFDCVFIGTGGIHRNGGLTCTSESSAQIKSEAIRNSVKTYVLADVSKFNRSNFVRFANLNEVTIICDQKPDFDSPDADILVADT